MLSYSFLIPIKPLNKYCISENLREMSFTRLSVFSSASKSSSNCIKYSILPKHSLFYKFEGHTSIKISNFRNAHVNSFVYFTARSLGKKSSDLIIPVFLVPLITAVTSANKSTCLKLKVAGFSQLTSLFVRSFLVNHPSSFLLVVSLVNNTFRKRRIKRWVKKAVTKSFSSI